MHYPQAGLGVVIAVASNVSGGFSATRSMDGGATWGDLTMPSTSGWTAIAANGSRFIACKSGPLWYYTDNPADPTPTWTAVPTPPTVTASILRYKAGVWYGVNSSTTNNIVYSVDNGMTWTVASTPVAGAPTDIYYSGTTFVIAGGANSAPQHYVAYGSSLSSLTGVGLGNIGASTKRFSASTTNFTKPTLGSTQFSAGTPAGPWTGSSPAGLPINTPAVVVDVWGSKIRFGDNGSSSTITTLSLGVWSNAAAPQNVGFVDAAYDAINDSVVVVADQLFAGATDLFLYRGGSAGSWTPVSPSKNLSYTAVAAGTE